MIVLCPSALKDSIQWLQPKTSKRHCFMYNPQATKRRYRKEGPYVNNVCKGVYNLKWASMDIPIIKSHIHERRKNLQNHKTPYQVPNSVIYNRVSEHRVISSLYPLYLAHYIFFRHNKICIKTS